MVMAFRVVAALFATLAAQQLAPAATSQVSVIQGLVKRADGTPFAGVPVVLREEPGWWSFFEIGVAHGATRTDSRGRFSFPAPKRQVRGGRLSLVAIGRVLRSRASDGTTVITGTGKAIDRISTTKLNVIVVPLNIRPGPMPKRRPTI